MKRALPETAAARLEAIGQDQLLDTGSDRAFDDLAYLAAHICQTPIALIHLTETKHQWLNSKVNLDVSTITTEIELSYLGVEQQDLVIIPDLLADENWANKSGENFSKDVRFYAGIPLITGTGQAIGTLCVIDNVPRQLSEEQVEALQALSRQVVSQWELRHHLTNVYRTTADCQQAEKALQQMARENLQLAQALDSVSDGVLITDPNQPDNPIVYANPAFSRITGYSGAEVQGRNCRFLQGSGTDRQAIANIREAIAQRRECQATLLNYRQDGQPFWNELKISPIFSDGGELLYFVGIQTDITERKRLEEERDRFFSLSLDMLCISGLDGYFKRLNPVFEKILGYSRAELQNQPFLNFVHPEDRQNTIQEWEKLAQGIPTLYFENRYHCKNETYKWLAWTAYAVVEDGLVYAIARDITPTKQAEKIMRQNQMFLDSIVENIPHMIFVKDVENFKFIRLNKAVTELIGIDKEEFIDKSDAEVFPHEEAEFFNAIDREVLSSGKLVDIPEELIQTKHQGVKILHTKKIPIFDPTGKPQYLLGISEDITERKLAEQQIREQATLLDKSQDAIMVLDTDQRIRFWNQSAQRLYGWTSDEVIGNYSSLLFKRFDPEINQIKTAVLTKGEWHGELSQITKDGKKIIVESRWTLVSDEQENPKSILIVNTDITENLLLETQFRRAQRMESIGTLAGGIAHDLNNILTPILTSVQILQMILHDDRSLRMLALLETNAKRAADLIKQVLSFARGLEGEKTTIQIEHLLLDLEKIAKETFPRSITISTNIPRMKLCLVYGDMTQLHQVFMNLCVNARDAMPNGGVLSISAENIVVDENYARINIDAKVGHYVVVTMADTGSGIPAEILERIFEPFFTTKEIGKGTGLGLSTVMGIIKGHDGFINVYSEVGQGTQFKVYLPAIITDEIETTTKCEKIPLGNGELILVVDDEAALCEVTKLSLEAYGYKVLTANDGIEAIAIYAQRKSDISLVLVDMMMPSMDGKTTIRTLVKINPAIKVIATSGLFSNSEGIVEVARQNVKTFLAKPYTSEQLLKTVHDVLKNP